MATVTRPKTTTEKGLGWRHQQEVEALRTRHRDGSPCDWCGRPRWLDRTRNYDYDENSTNPSSGSLHGDHSGMSRAEALRRNVPIPLPNRLLHGACNIQRGEGHNDHLAAVNAMADEATTANGINVDQLSMPWPWAGGRTGA